MTAETSDLKIVEDATCTFCGCVCDDMELTVEGEGRDAKITKAKNACVLGKAWFFNHHVEERPEATIDGQPAGYDEAMDKAAEILLGARYPITYGLSDTTCEAQRVAVAITDWVGGCLDTTTSVCHGPSGMAFQGVGEVTCSLGEIKNRADYLIFWGGNPAESHPRHFTKYSLMPKGEFVPNGRKDRTAVLIDVRKTKSAKAANIFLQIKPRSDFELAWALRGLAKGLEIDPSIEEKTGIPLEQLQEVMDGMKRAKFGAILFGMGVTMTRGKHINSEAVLALARDMNEHTRWVAKPMRGHGNVTGADNVVSWSTGYPFGGQPGTRIPAVQSGRIHDGRHARPRRSRRGTDHRQRPRCRTSVNRPASIWRRFRVWSWIPNSARRPKSRRWRSQRRPMASTRRAQSIAWTTFRSRYDPPSTLPTKVISKS